MFHLQIEWPFLAALALMTLAGISEVMLKKVGNGLTLGGAAVALLSCIESPTPWNSLILTFLSGIVALATILHMHTHQGLGAGCVKAQFAFGMWVGLGMSFRMRSGAVLVILCMVFAIIVLKVWSSMIRYRISESDNSAGAVEGVMLPAQLPLSLGNVLCLFAFLVANSP